MIEPRTPKFQWGQAVSAAQDLFNDGSHPGYGEDALIVRAGDRGEVVQVGTHVETSTPVYLIEFAGALVVGCLEDEIDAI